MAASTGLAALGFGAVMAIMFLILFLIAIVIAAFIFWLLMLIDCIKRDFRNDTEKIVWILLMVFLHVLASVIYYFVVKREDKKAKKRS